MIDPLSRLLTVAGVRGSLISRARLSAPFGVRAAAPRAVFHAPLKGSAWIASGDIVEHVEVGDVAVLPRGATHEVTDAPGRVCQRITEYPVESSDAHLPTVTDFSESPELDLLCGAFSLGRPANRWLIDPLPDLFVVRGAHAATSFVQATLGLLETELATGGLGSTVLSDRLVEVLVVHILRAWMSGAADAPSGWFGAMTDPNLTRVLTAVHADPAGDWTLESMAKVAAMSRTRFAARFRECVGEAPGTWLTEWRIAVAGRELRDGADVARAAESAGYASEASFSRAFKRVMGMSPGAWRSTAIPA